MNAIELERYHKCLIRLKTKRVQCGVPETKKLVLTTNNNNIIHITTKITEIFAREALIKTKKKDIRFENRG